jgi:hypothetical protein
VLCWLHGVWCFTSIYKSVNGDRRQRALTSKAFLHVAPEMVRAPLHPTSSTQPFVFKFLVRMGHG